MTELGPKSMPADLLKIQAQYSAPPPYSMVAGRFRLVKALGNGAMAVVYQARDQESDKRVAVKLLRPELVKDREATTRFRVEVLANQYAQHPHLVSFIDAGIHDGLPYLAMEWIPGPSLKTWVDQRGPLPPKLALKLIAQLGRGLGAMHREGMIHRDVKPQNVLLALEDEEPKLAKLADLGFAKIPSVRRVTRGGNFVGTAAYMAPEQVVQDPLDERCDVYGLGASLYYALTGEVLFDGPVANVFLHHLHTTPAPPSWLAPDLTEDMDELVMTMLRKHPNNRYRSTLAVAADIAHILRQEPLRGIRLKVKPDHYKPISSAGREAMSVFDELKNKLHTTSD